MLVRLLFFTAIFITTHLWAGASVSALCGRQSAPVVNDRRPPLVAPNVAAREPAPSSFLGSAFEEPKKSALPLPPPVLPKAPLTLPQVPEVGDKVIIWSEGEHKGKNAQVNSVTFSATGAVSQVNVTIENGGPIVNFSLAQLAYTYGLCKNNGLCVGDESVLVMERSIRVFGTLYQIQLGASSLNKFLQNSTVEYRGPVRTNAYADRTSGPVKDLSLETTLWIAGKIIGAFYGEDKVVVENANGKHDYSLDWLPAKSDPQGQFVVRQEVGHRNGKKAEVIGFYAKNTKLVAVYFPTIQKYSVEKRTDLAILANANGQNPHFRQGDTVRKKQGGELGNIIGTFIGNNREVLVQYGNSKIETTACVDLAVLNDVHVADAGNRRFAMEQRVVHTDGRVGEVTGAFPDSPTERLVHFFASKSYEPVNTLSLAELGKQPANAPEGFALGQTARNKDGTFGEIDGFFGPSQGSYLVSVVLDGVHRSYYTSNLLVLNTEGYEGFFVGEIVLTHKGEGRIVGFHGDSIAVRYGAGAFLFERQYVVKSGSQASASNKTPDN